MKFDVCFDIQHTVPCNWMMHMRIFTAGKNTEGESDGQLIADTWSCQAVTPCDDESVDYYYSWGASKATEFPGFSEMLARSLEIAFDEDRRQLEAQHIRRSEKPDFKMINIVHDAGPGKMIWVLDKLIQAEQSDQRVA